MLRSVQSLSPQTHVDTHVRSHVLAQVKHALSSSDAAVPKVSADPPSADAERGWAGELQRTREAYMHERQTVDEFKASLWALTEPSSAVADRSPARAAAPQGALDVTSSLFDELALGARTGSGVNGHAHAFISSNLSVHADGERRELDRIGG